MYHTLKYGRIVEISWTITLNIWHFLRVLEQLNDVFVAFIPVMFEKDPVVKIRKEAKFFAENVPAHLAVFEKRLAEPGRQFLVGDCLTVADLYFMVIADTLKEKSCMSEQVVFAKYRSVAAFVKKMRSLPAVVEYNNKTA